MKTDFLNSSGLGAAWAILITIAVAPLGTGCVFMDDADSRVRGYTECGSFMGGESCSPGQYCSDPQFSQCDLGCLSDVNCASNQTCVEGGSGVASCASDFTSGSALATETLGTRTVTVSTVDQVGNRREPEELMSDLRTPDEDVAPRWWTLRVTQSDGSMLEGLRMNEDTFSMRLMDDDENLWSLSKSDVRSYDRVKTSTMPTVDGALTDAEVDDLVAYLFSLRREEN